MIFRRTKSLVGLDIGSSAVKAVELRQVSSGYKVVAIGSEPVPADCIVDGAIIDGGANSRPSVLFVFSPSTPAVDTPVFFDASASQPTVPGRTLVSYAWVFGDGATGSGPTTSHTYSSASTYRVTLTVTDNLGEKNTPNATVPVGAVVVSASFTATITPLVSDRVVNFDASASTGSGLSYTWNFGDGAIVTETVPTITYAFVDDSTRNVVLTVTDIAGNTASTTVTVDPEP